MITQLVILPTQRNHLVRTLASTGWSQDAWSWQHVVTTGCVILATRRDNRVRGLDNMSWLQWAWPWEHIVTTRCVILTTHRDHGERDLANTSWPQGACMVSRTHRTNAECVALTTHRHHRGRGHDNTLYLRSTWSREHTVTTGCVMVLTKRCIVPENGSWPKRSWWSWKHVVTTARARYLKKTSWPKVRGLLAYNKSSPFPVSSPFPISPRPPPPPPPQHTSSSTLRLLWWNGWTIHFPWGSRLNCLPCYTSNGDWSVCVCFLALDGASASVSKREVSAHLPVSSQDCSALF